MTQKRQRMAETQPCGIGLGPLLIPFLFLSWMEPPGFSFSGASLSLAHLCPFCAEGRGRGSPGGEPWGPSQSLGWGGQSGLKAVCSAATVKASVGKIQRARI